MPRLKERRDVGTEYGMRDRKPAVSTGVTAQPHASCVKCSELSHV